jgi:hypothetical protein
VFVTSITVQIVRDGCVTRPGFRFSGTGRWLWRVQSLIRHRQGAAKFTLIHESTFLDQREYGYGPVIYGTVCQAGSGAFTYLSAFAAQLSALNMQS